jgi:hypothetical protein
LAHLDITTGCTGIGARVGSRIGSRVGIDTLGVAGLGIAGGGLTRGLGVSFHINIKYTRRISPKSPTNPTTIRIF